MRRHFPERGPGADVVPADVEGQHGGGAGPLHDRVVDGHGGRAGKGFAVEAQEAQIFLGFGEGFAGRFEDIGLQPRQLLDKGASAENEDAAVPNVLVGRNVALRCRLVGLFGEGSDAIGAVKACQRRTAPDVAVAGVRRLGVMPNRTNLPVADTLTARRTASTNPGSSLITWSEGMTTSTPAGSWRAT